MCIGIPMQVLPESADMLMAWCEGHDRRREQLDMLLVGAQPARIWVLAFHGAARRVLDEDEAHSINRALGALDAALADGAAPPDLSACFPDLIGREPQLPEHLRNQR
jgi:hydrogenase expression/formation protein HypC